MNRVLDLTWAVLKDTPTLQKNDLHSSIFKNRADLDRIAGYTTIGYAPQLLGILNNPLPPTPDTLASLPTDFHDRWGVYMLFLTKTQCRPKIYIGCATSTESFKVGLESRYSDYDLGNWPVYVQKSIDEGYVVEHRLVLLHCPVPSWDDIFELRPLFYAMEAGLCYAFAAVLAFQGNFALSHLSVWPLSTLHIDGLCSHNALADGIALPPLPEGTPEDLILGHTVDRLEAKRARDRARYHESMKDPKWRAKHRALTKEYQEANPDKAKETARKTYLRTLALKKHFCPECSRAFASNKDLNRHKNGSKHLAQISIRLPEPL